MKRTLEMIDQDIASIDQLQKFIQQQRSALIAERTKHLRRFTAKNPTRDMLNQPCISCARGVLKEFDQWGDYLRCTVCLRETDRRLPVDSDTVTQLISQGR